MTLMECSRGSKGLSHMLGGVMERGHEGRLRSQSMYVSALL